MKKQTPDPYAPPRINGDHAPDILSCSELHQIEDRLSRQQWISRADMQKLAHSHALTAAALAGAVTRGWSLAEDLAARGDDESAERLRDWCRHMRRVCPVDFPGLPRMPAAERKVVRV